MKYAFTKMARMFSGKNGCLLARDLAPGDLPKKKEKRYHVTYLQ